MLLRSVQYAANLPTSEQSTEMAPGKDGRDDVSSEYPEVFRQAVEALTAGGSRRALKEENGGLGTLTSLAVGTIARFGRTSTQSVTVPSDRAGPDDRQS